MSVPPYVPQKAVSANLTFYRSPRRRVGGWLANRPGEVVSSQEQTSDFCLSYQGPDQGYAFRLARLFEKRLCLADKEKQTDVVAGCVALALKRASLLGRAPMIGDLQKAFDLFGFLSTNASRELITRRQKIFAGASNHGCDRILRDLVDLVPASSLGLSDVDHPVAEL